VGVPAARALGLRRFRGRSLALALVVLPTTVPPLAVALGLDVAFLRLGLAGTVLGVVLVHLLPVLPYVVLALVGVFERYDEAYEWQAATLGAGPLTRLVRVSLPLLAPGIAVAALFGFLASWTQYVLTLLVGGGQVVTLPLLVFAAAAGGNPATTAGLALLLALPPMLAVALTARALGGATTIGQQY
jgi:putative spermidine/putrescine transport system permease protein